MLIYDRAASRKVKGRIGQPLKPRITARHRQSPTRKLTDREESMNVTEYTMADSGAAGYLTDIRRGDALRKMPCVL
jgi:hypothetical protein